jgi:hypothetical protein
LKNVVDAFGRLLLAGQHLFCKSWEVAGWV